MLESVKSIVRRTPLPATLVRAGGFSVVMLAVTGCVGNQVSASGPSVPDTGIVTGSIPAGTSTAASKNKDAGNGSNLAALRTAVVAASPADASASGIPWADPDTGTVGVIRSIAEIRSDGRLCRRFRTTRHDYKGVALYDGKACRSAPGRWQIVEFRSKSTDSKPGTARHPSGRIG